MIQGLQAKEHAGRTKSRRGGLVPVSMVASAVVLLASAPGAGSHHSTPTTATATGDPTTTASATTTGPSTGPTTSRPTTKTTHPVVLGELTVLSPIGLNVRAEPSRSAKVIGIAAQGVALALVGHTDKDGGWYRVGGATVIGWISADPRYTAPGRFGYYSSSAFNVLFPAGWTTSGKPATGVVFRPRSSPEEIVIKASTSVAKLSSVNGKGISEYSSQQIDACGVTAYLYSYTSSSHHTYYADAAMSLGSGHALGLKATLTSLSQMKIVLDFVNSISFPLPICVGKPPTKQ
ncbi:MAG TPA: SH3 domain-containing protein [Acidimicrobiales bacterium]|nr:SH3 domain-containing protein [Acidimicrobiales bacterium]